MSNEVREVSPVTFYGADEEDIKDFSPHVTPADLEEAEDPTSAPVRVDVLEQDAADLASELAGAANPGGPPPASSTPPSLPSEKTGKPTPPAVVPPTTAIPPTLTPGSPNGEKTTPQAN